MIKIFCDCCNVEITDKNKIDNGDFRLIGKLKNRKGIVVLTVEVITAKNSTWNAGDFCKYCVIDAINKSDDRDKPVEGLAK